MSNRVIRQPMKLSIEEWKLLQLLATNKEPFDVEAVFKDQQAQNDLAAEKVPLTALTFYRRFNHIKNCGYLVSVPLSEAEKKEGSQRQLFQVTANAINATNTEEAPPPPPKYGRPRKI